MKVKATPEQRIGSHLNAMIELRSEIIKNNGQIRSKRHIEICKQYRVSAGILASMIEKGYIRRLSPGIYRSLVAGFEPWHARIVMDHINESVKASLAKAKETIKKHNESPSILDTSESDTIHDLNAPDEPKAPYFKRYIRFEDALGGKHKIKVYNKRGNKNYQEKKVISLLVDLFERKLNTENFRIETVKALFPAKSLEEMLKIHHLYDDKVFGGVDDIFIDQGFSGKHKEPDYENVAGTPNPDYVEPKKEEELIQAAKSYDETQVEIKPKKTYQKRSKGGREISILWGLIKIKNTF